MEMSNESFEFVPEGEQEVFDEAELQELAAEMLSVTQEAELNQFLRGLIKKAAGAVGKAVSSPLGQRLGGMLKDVAKKALPVAGRAVTGVADQAGSMFGLETEGLSHEDREFEVAKQFVRLAADATKSAVSTPEAGQATDVARAAVTQAAQKFAPGLLSSAARRQGGGQGGRWVRKGRKIVIYGV